MIDDNNFEDKISNSSAFGDDNVETIVVEFWAEFNEANCFTDWNKIQNAKYYRVDIAKAPIHTAKPIKIISNLPNKSAMFPPLFICFIYLISSLFVQRQLVLLFCYKCLKIF